MTRFCGSLDTFAEKLKIRRPAIQTVIGIFVAVHRSVYRKFHPSPADKGFVCREGGVHPLLSLFFFSSSILFLSFLATIIVVVGNVIEKSRKISFAFSVIGYKRLFSFLFFFFFFKYSRV